MPHPCMHGFGSIGKVIGNHEKKLHASRESLGRPGGDFRGASYLFPRRQQMAAIAISPTVELRIGQFQPLRPQAFGKSNDLAEPVNVSAVQDHIQGKRDLGLFDQPDSFQLAFMRLNAGNLITQFRAIGLKTDLDAVEARALEIFQPPRRQTESTGNEICIQARLPGRAREFREVWTRQRFATGKADMQRAQLRGVKELPPPLVRREFPASGAQGAWIGAVWAM